MVEFLKITTVTVKVINQFGLALEDQLLAAYKQRHYTIGKNANLHLRSSTKILKKIVFFLFDL